MCKRLGAIGKSKFHLYLNKTFEEYEDFAIRLVLSSIKNLRGVTRIWILIKISHI